MTTTQPATPIQGYTTSVRTVRGRLVIHIDLGTLLMLGASEADTTTHLATLLRHMPRLHAVALRLSAQGSQAEVTIRPGDVSALRHPACRSKPCIVQS